MYFDITSDIRALLLDDFIKDHSQFLLMSNYINWCNFLNGWKTIQSFIQYRPQCNVSKSSFLESRARERSRTSNGCSGKQQWHGITVINTGIFIKRGCVNERREKKIQRKDCISRERAPNPFSGNNSRVHFIFILPRPILSSSLRWRIWQDKRVFLTC